MAIYTEADEMCSVVGKKANKQWIWIGMDTQTRQVIAFHVGDRSRKSAEQLWGNIPAAYHERATFYTDRSEAYTGVIPAAQHKAITKLARKTNHIERFNKRAEHDSCKILAHWLLRTPGGPQNPGHHKHGYPTQRSL